MPVYEYECASCGKRFEVLQRFSDPAISVCKFCNATTVRKVLSPTSFVLKGSGWYVTDYASNDRKKKDDAGKPCSEGTSSGCSSGTCPSGDCTSKGSS